VEQLDRNGYREEFGNFNYINNHGWIRVLVGRLGKRSFISPFFTVYEDWQGEELVFGYEIAILVIIEAFAQLTRLKELILDLLIVDH